MRTQSTAWVTKYALTIGILEKRVEDCFNIAEDMVSVVDSHDCYHGKEWHRTREAAIARAEEMRVAKITSFKKQIAKLEKLTFLETTK